MQHYSIRRFMWAARNDDLPARWNAGFQHHDAQDLFRHSWHGYLIPGGWTRLEGSTWYEFEMYPQDYCNRSVNR